jgi:glycosyl hydrolase family 99
MSCSRRSAVTLAILASCALAPGPTALGASHGHPAVQTAAYSRSAPAGSVIPLLAYYYIWFTPRSWNRAKIDYPAIGRYSSGDASVMRRQIEQAKSAGIDGFIVSWKDTPTDNSRLRMLVSVALQEHFKLAMIYEGLNFYRHPLPVSEVATAFELFRDTYARSPAFFRLDGKPLTIWSGTWDYSHAAVASVTSKVRGSLLVLNTEKNVRGFLRLADVTDGDAYYWSSVNPATDTHYGDKLSQMSRAVHQRGEYWIAPFAPGFDARLVGGKSDVRRDGGQTLRTEYASALGSAPDVLGLISWNEFSENTYVEPSLKFGSRYLSVLRELRLTSAPAPPSAADSSSDPGKATTGGYVANLMRLGGFAVALVAGVGMIGYVRRRRMSRGKRAMLS